VPVALLGAAGAPDGARPTIMFLTKEAVRLATNTFAVGTACDGCPPIAELMDRYRAADGQFLVCPLCFKARKIADDSLLPNASIGGTAQLWEWIGDGATTFSY
jgi:predicted peroxiredoxin